MLSILAQAHQTQNSIPSSINQQRRTKTYPVNMTYLIDSHKIPRLQCNLTHTVRHITIPSPTCICLQTKHHRKRINFSYLGRFGDTMHAADLCSGAWEIIRRYAWVGVKSGRVSGKQCECRGDVTARPTHHNQDTKTDFGRVICLLVSGYVDICSLAEELYFAGHIAIAISQHVHIPCTGLTVAFWYARCA
jgi:hypothetical protein